MEREGRGREGRVGGSIGEKRRGEGRVEGRKREWRRGKDWDKRRIRSKKMEPARKISGEKRSAKEDEGNESMRQYGCKKFAKHMGF